jgi:5-methylcytosine-specific restriction endonuclease McrA
MFNPAGFLIAQTVAWSLFGLWKLGTRPKKPLHVEQPDVSHKWVMPSIRVIGQTKTYRVHYERIPLTKRQRFEILKRDNFTCQYCGRKPPAVTLEVDHIKSVYGGGNNEPRNLITSCLDCNRGKGADSLV